MLKRLSVTGFLCLVCLSALAQEFTVDQQDKRFSVSTITVKVGDQIRFMNNDPFFHNIFSLSDIKTFDLGSYPKGQSRTVTFTNPGTVEVECAIHPEMKLIVEIVK